MTNLVTYTNGKNWTRFSMTPESETVRQASSKGLMRDISRGEALARMRAMDAQGRWTRTHKLVRF